MVLAQCDQEKEVKKVMIRTMSKKYSIPLVLLALFALALGLGFRSQAKIIRSQGTGYLYEPFASSPTLSFDLSSFMLSVGVLGAMIYHFVGGHKNSRKYRIRIIFVLLSMIVIFSGFMVGQVYAEVMITPGSFTETASYTIWEEGGTYYAKNGSYSEVEYSGNNASTVINQALSHGGKVLVKWDNYQLTGSLVVSVSGTVFEGEGVEVTFPSLPLDYDDIPTAISGTVFNVTVADKHAIVINGNLTGIEIKNLGIKFTGSGRGRGISLEPPAQEVGMLYSSIENVIVWNHNETYYSFFFENVLQCRFTDLWSFGGPAFHFKSNSNNKKFGCDMFERLSARTDSTLNLTKNISEFLGTDFTHEYGLSVIKGLKIMDRALSSSGYALFMEYFHYNEIIALNIEDPVSNKSIFIKDCCYNNIEPVLVFGGQINHTGAQGHHNSYVGSGRIDYGPHGMVTTCPDDFIEHSLDLVGSGSFSGWKKATRTVWLDAPSITFKDENRAASMGATADVDCTLNTSSKAIMAFVKIEVHVDTVGNPNTTCYVELRKKGTAPTDGKPTLRIYEPICQPNSWHDSAPLLIGLDSGQEFSYQAFVGAGAWQIDIYFIVIAYIEE